MPKLVSEMLEVENNTIRKKTSPTTSQFSRSNEDALDVLTATTAGMWITLETSPKNTSCAAFTKMHLGSKTNQGISNETNHE
jgi:hypothetical protein